MSFPENMPEVHSSSSSLAFYKHFEDPPRQFPPNLLRLKPLPPAGNLKEQLEQRQEAVAERFSSLQDEKVQKLSVRLARVALITDRHQRQATSSWKDAQERFRRDMDDHVRRRTAQISQRLQNLASHNRGVQERRDEVKRERFLQKLDQLYATRKTSTISRVFKSI